MTSLQIVERVKVYQEAGFSSRQVIACLIASNDWIVETADFPTDDELRFIKRTVDNAIASENVVWPTNGGS